MKRYAVITTVYDPTCYSTENWMADQLWFVGYSKEECLDFVSQKGYNRFLSMDGHQSPCIAEIDPTDIPKSMKSMKDREVYPLCPGNIYDDERDFFYCGEVDSINARYNRDIREWVIDGEKPLEPKKPHKYFKRSNEMKINENSKITLTVGQLKRLVKESTEQDNPVSNDDAPVHSYNSASLKKAVNTRLLNLFGNLAYFNDEYVERVSPTDSKNAVEIYGPWYQFERFVNGYLKEPNLWNISGSYIYAYEDHLSLRINLTHTYYNPYKQTKYDAYLFEFPFRRCKISVENEGSKTYTIVEMTTSKVYTRGYGSWDPIRGHQTMTLKFKGDVLAKVSKRDLKDQNFGLELKDNIMKSVDDELDISSYDCSYSFNPETKSMSIRCNGGGKAYGDGYSYSGSCKLKYWGDKWKVVSSYSDDGGKHDSSIRDAALRICGNMASVFRNYGKKLPREVNVRLYVEYD